jgi:hypothetical protein
MAPATPTRFPIRFDAWYAALSSVLLLPKTSAYVEIAGDEIRVRMGWAFRARFPRSAVASVVESRERPVSRGVHGFAGRWLVNGSAQGILVIGLKPTQRAYVLGFPVRLRQLLVSVDDPFALAKALTGEGASPSTRGRSRS